jgi:hypothetical protein
MGPAEDLEALCYLRCLKNNGWERSSTRQPDERPSRVLHAERTSLGYGAPQAALRCWRAVSGCPDISAGGVMSLSLIRLSRIPSLESRQNQRKLCAFRTGLVTPPILATPGETFRFTSHCSDTQQHRRAPSSRPTQCRRTPIATTGLRFSAYLNAEGGMEMRITG